MEIMEMAKRKRAREQVRTEDELPALELKWYYAISTTPVEPAVLFATAAGAGAPALGHLLITAFLCGGWMLPEGRQSEDIKALVAELSSMPVHPMPDHVDDTVVMELQDLGSDIEDAIDHFIHQTTNTTTRGGYSTQAGQAAAGAAPIRLQGQDCSVQIPKPENSKSLKQRSSTSLDCPVGLGPSLNATDFGQLTRRARNVSQRLRDGGGRTAAVQQLPARYLVGTAQLTGELPELLVQAAVHRRRDAASPLDRQNLEPYITATVAELREQRAYDCYRRSHGREVVCIYGSYISTREPDSGINQAADEQFQCRAFVSLRGSPDITEVLRAIREQVITKPRGGTQAVPQQVLMDEISISLENKRYLVIIDHTMGDGCDAWAVWQIIQNCLPKNSLGSRILILTSFTETAEKFLWDNNEVAVYKLESYARGNIKSNPLYEIVETHHSDIPIALIYTAQSSTKIRHLVSRHTNGGSYDTTFLKPLAESLCRRYNDLPLHLRAFLLYCSIYHWRDRIERHILVRRFLAEGFVYKKDAAQGFFDDLVSKEWIKPEGGSKYRIHPVIVAFLRCQLQENNFVTCSGFGSSDILPPHTRRIRRLYLQQGRSFRFSELDLTNTRSLYVFDGANTVPFKRFEHLIVLDLQGTEDLDDADVVDICGILQLRYLCLRKTPVRQLPPEIGKLTCLETLDISHTRIRNLPRDIGKLQHLKTLDLNHTEVSDLPPEIGGLECLETLDISHTKIRELPRDIGKLQHLKTLDLNHTEVSDLPPEIGGLECLESLDASHTKIRELPFTTPPHVAVFKVSGIHMHVPPSVKQHLSALSSLDIRLCRLIHEGDDIKFLREMPNLKALVLRLEVLPRKPIPISRIGFAKLESFFLDSRLPRVTFQPDAMPKLKFLGFKFYAGPASEHPVGISHLRNLEKVVFRCSPWYKSDSPGISATIAIARREAKGHHNRITICINDNDEEVYPGKETAQICTENRDAGNGNGNGKNKKNFHDKSDVELPWQSHDRN